jgi:DNA polymerase III gamma/tau subunit
MNSIPLINKYRPEDWDEIIGHEDIVASLQRSLTSDSHPHAFLFSGPGGVGKTTMARIVAHTLKAELVEIDAATFSGIDSMREVVSLGSHMSLSGEGRRLILIDEVHGLSKPAFQALLKILEEPPEHLYFALATTEVNKVPETIRIRCFHAALRPISNNDISILLETVIASEEWDVPDDVIQAVIQAGTGQPRKALSILQAVHGCQDRDEVRRIIKLHESTDALKDLMQALLKGATWDRLKVLLEQIPDDEFEEALIPMGRYIMGAMVKADKDKASDYWRLLDALTFPSQTFDPKARFYAAFGRMLWGDK